MVLLHTSAGRLASRRRRTLAIGLEHAVRRAERPAGGFSAGVPVDHQAIRQCRERLLAIAGILRSERHVPDLGMAAARRLLTDGSSPLYVDGTHLPRTVTALEILMGLH